MLYLKYFLKTVYIYYMHNTDRHCLTAVKSVYGWLGVVGARELDERTTYRHNITYIISIIDIVIRMHYHHHHQQQQQYPNVSKYY